MARDLGRYVLTAQVTASLKGDVTCFDVPEIVETFIEQYGFVDVGEVDAESYWNIVWKHRTPPVV